MDLQRTIEERDKTLKKMIDTFMNMNGVLGIFLSGSLAEGTSDAYSDIDFRVVVDEENYQEVFNHRAEYPEKWGELLFTESLPYTNYCIAHYRPFFKVDIFYYRVPDLKPSPWYARAIEILFEKDFLLTNVIQESKHLQFITSEASVNSSIGKGIAHIHEVYRRVKRGELIYARELLSGVRLQIIEADDILNHYPPQGYSHYESRGDSEVLHVINSSYQVNNSEEILLALDLLTVLYRKQVVKVHEVFGVKRDLTNDLFSIDLITSL